MASVRSQDEAFGYTIGTPPSGKTQLTTNGVHVRNLIQGSDIVMSHILHLYHLSALDFINTSTYPGMSPWTPSYTIADMVNGATGVGAALVADYVEALEIRRKAHVMGAIFNAKHPCGASPVAGGVTEVVTTDKINQFKPLLDEIRHFINTKYIPDVVTVASSYTAYWGICRGCLNFLSYGDFPTPGVEPPAGLAITRGRVSLIPSPLSLTAFALNTDHIQEDVKYSYYSSPSGLHPSIGVTTPDAVKSGAYSWLKAPRIWASGGEGKPGGSTYTSGDVVPHEVGPLARVLVSYVNSNATAVSQAATLGSSVTVSPCIIPTTTGTYNITTLVGDAVATYNSLAVPDIGLTDLLSPLGRHLARALECKFIADAMSAWIQAVTPDAPTYAARSIPVSSTGAGLVEAPRGALGHWIHIEGKKIFNYQCVVPTTWNCSPMDDDGNYGPAEQTLVGNNISTDAKTQIVNVLRLLHPFDFCIACAVHLIGTDGKEIGRFATDPNGNVTDYVVNPE